MKQIQSLLICTDVNVKHLSSYLSSDALRLLNSMKANRQIIVMNSSAACTASLPTQKHLATASNAQHDVPVTPSNAVFDDV